MKRSAFRALLMFALAVAVVSSARAQNALPDSIEVRSRKDGSVRTVRGQLKVTPAGFQVFTGDKLDKAGEVFAPDDVLKVTAGELPGLKAELLNAARAKEEAALKTKDDKKAPNAFPEAAAEYKKLAATAGVPDRTKRYLDFKAATLAQRVVDDMDSGDPVTEPGKAAREAWGKAADKAVSDWKDFVTAYTAAGKFGWEVWPAARTLTRLQAERGKYGDAATVWADLRKVGEVPPDVKVEAALQEIDARIRAKGYPLALAATDAPELKKAAGAQGERLGILTLAARAGSDGKYLEGVEQIKGAMEKSKDPGAHATGYAMMGELYFAAGKPRDAMWMFLWVETVVNQDRDEVFKAVSRLAELFEAQNDEEQARRYREKIRRLRTQL